jgi:hypothetical protein
MSYRLRRYSNLQCAGDALDILRPHPIKPKFDAQKTGVMNLVSIVFSGRFPRQVARVYARRISAAVRRVLGIL